MRPGAPGFLRRGEPRQRLQALGDDVGMRRQPVVGQAVPGREDQHLAARGRRNAGRPAGAPAAGRRAPRAECPRRRSCGRAPASTSASAPFAAGRRWSSGRACAWMRRRSVGEAARPLEPHAKRQQLAQHRCIGLRRDRRPGRRPSRRCRCRSPPAARSYWSSSAESNAAIWARANWPRRMSFSLLPR